MLVKIRTGLLIFWGAMAMVSCGNENVEFSGGKTTRVDENSSDAISAGQDSVEGSGGNSVGDGSSSVSDYVSDLDPLAGGDGGSSNNTSGSSPGDTGSGDSNDTVTNPPTSGGTLGLTWNWDCSGTNSQSGTSISGEGPFSFSKSDQINIDFNGQVCEPSARQRDLVFLIDVSGSMSSRDNPTFGKCNRFKAVQEILNSLPTDGSVRVSLATYDHEIKASFSGFGNNPATFLSELESQTGEDADDTLCKNLIDTNFGIALDFALTSFQNYGRSVATKEVYLITDGQPDGTTNGASPAELEAYRGLGEFADLEAMNAKVASIMIGSTDATALLEVTSSDPSGQKLHQNASNASDLSTTLSDMATNNIAGAMFYYRNIGNQNWEVLNFTSDLQPDGTYSLPTLSLNSANYPNGIEFSYIYWDQQGYYTEKHSQINWTTK